MSTTDTKQANTVRQAIPFCGCDAYAEEHGHNAITKRASEMEEAICNFAVALNEGLSEEDREGLTKDWDVVLYHLEKMDSQIRYSLAQGKKKEEATAVTG